ncbi:tyrosine-type recombinase/integrase [Sulfitobacter sp. 1A12126]|uniref:tyrosine-type recombinase/integrase n=1 Tax=Sulfitobacter sp. 1A12126 TaxID=3368591 RepID=UPI0037468741
MARIRNQLTAVAIRKAGPGKLEDGGGLRLYKTEGSGRWVFRYTFSGMRREMGLGSLDDLTLAQARSARDKWASVLASGLDPITERKRQRAETAAELSRSDPTFEELALTVFESKKASLRGEGTRGRWFSPLATHIIPRLGKRRISQIDQTDIAEALRPIWHDKPATAEKAFHRMRIIFRKAKLMGLDADPFVVEAAAHILGDVKRKVEHIAATPWREVPGVYARLNRSGASFRCLRWMILTATRSESARGARFSEIEGDVWTIPAERMKGTQGDVEAFRVPLSSEALRLLEEFKKSATGDLMFPSYRSGYISSTALQKVLNEMGEAGRPHGFRTSFRSWVQDTEAASFDVAETALAHRVGSTVERSYARSDLLDQRRVLMERWSTFVTGETAKVVKLRG